MLGQLWVDRSSIVVEGRMDQDWERELEVLLGLASLVELDQHTELVCDGQDSGVGHGDGLLDQIGLWDLEAAAGLEVLPRVGWGGRLCTVVGCCCADDGSMGFDACLWNKCLYFFLDDVEVHFVDLEPVVQHPPPALEPEMELVQPLRIQLLGHMELKLDLASAPAVVCVLFAVALVDLVLPGLDPEGDGHRERVVDQHIAPAQGQSRSERVLED